MKLKSKNIFKKASAMLLIFSAIFGSNYFTKINTNNIDINNLGITENINIGLQSELASISMAKLYSVEDMIYKENNKPIRFDIGNFECIDVIVDENSLFCMTDENKQAIRNAVNDYNKLFEYINPEYKFNYIPYDEYKNENRKNPCIVITSQLKITGTNGQRANAITSKPKSVKNDTEIGLTTNNSYMILSSTGLISLSVDQITNIIKHELAHSLCVGNHSNDPMSIMYTHSSKRTIASSKFSSDVLYTLLSLYYNPLSNPKSLSEIKNYLNYEAELREKEILSAFPESEEFIDDTYINNNLQNNLSKEELNKIYSDLFSKNAINYVNNNNTSLGNSQTLIGKSFTSTSMYGLSTTITFNPDGTYSYTLKQNDKCLSANGTYEIINNHCICTGSFVQINTKTLEFQEYSNIFIYEALSNGSILEGNLKNKFMISQTLSIDESEMQL